MTGELEYRSRRVLVLGATGFIGRWVARRLTDTGAELWLVTRNAENAVSLWSVAGIRGTPVETDLMRPDSAAALVRAIRPSITFNLAGYGVDPAELEEDAATRINAALVAELADAVSEHQDPAWTGQHLIHAGSAAEYGRASGDLAEETTPLPVSLYGRTKLAGTEALGARTAAGRLRGTTARLFTVYGPGERKGRLLPSLLHAAGSGQPLGLTAGTQRRDFTYVEDVAEGLLRLGVLLERTPGLVNLATGKLESVRGFAERTAAVLGFPSERLQFGVLPGRAGEMVHGEVRVERLRNLCGWIPSTGIEEGVRRTMHHRANRA